MSTDFYRAFEDRYRGDRQLIKQRLRVYLPFILPLTATHPELSVLDLGCGRGEWLELMRENSIPAYGLDLDDGMLSACRERQLNATHGDAITHLKSLADKSTLAISGFHLAEHLPFPVLQTLLAEALRTLIPGGLLILETPNPENLVVGTASFYIDPTHQRPLPTQLLLFLAENQGFSQVKLLRLQEESRLTEESPVELYDVLGNVSPDYAIIAQAPSRTPQPKALAQAFAAEHGVSLYALASRYDQHLQANLNGQLQIIHTVQTQAEKALAIAHQANLRADQTNTELSALHTELSAIYASHSWQITRPLRWLARIFRSRP